MRCELLYCRTQGFQKESAGPHLGNWDVNTHKRRCLDLGLCKYWSFYPFLFSMIFCMLFFFSSLKKSSAVLQPACSKFRTRNILD